MADDLEAGRLHLDAYVDTTGITRGLQARIDREMRTIKAKIRAQVDPRGLVTSARAAARIASESATVKFRATVNEAGLAVAAREAAQRASSTARIDIKAGVSVDQGSVQAAESRITAAVGDKDVSIDVDADTAAATAKAEAFRQSQSRPINIPINANTAGLAGAGQALASFSAIPAIIGGVYTLGAAVVQLGGGLVSMASAASQAVGVLAAIPNLAGIAVQAVASIGIGFSGIGTALKGLGEQQKTATTTAKTAAAAQVDSARRVADARAGLAQAVRQEASSNQQAARAVVQARRAVGDAERQRADNARQSAQAIRQAEWSLQEAHEGVREAQEDLTKARKEAREEIHRLNEELALSAGDETVAMNALIKAREDLRDTNYDDASSEQERRDARSALIEAEQNLKRVRSKRRELKKDADEANKAGVEGSERVQDARENLSDSMHVEQQAVIALANARRSAARTAAADDRAVADARAAVGQAEAARAEQARSGAEAVAKAQRALRDAQLGTAAAATEQTAAQVALNNAMDALSPAGRRFVRFLYSLKPRWTEFKQAVQTSLLPPIQRGVEAALPLLDVLQTGLVDSAGVVGGLGERLGRLFGSPAFRTDVTGIMASNNAALRDFADVGFNLVRILRDLAVVAGPVLVEPFARWLSTLTRAGAAATEAGRASGGLEGFLRRAGDRAAQLGDIFWNLASALFGVGRAAIPAGDGLLDQFEKTTAAWSEFANSDAGQEKMRQFFDAVGPVTTAFGELVASFSEFLVLAGGSDTSAVITFFKVLTAILDGLNKLMAIPGVGPVVGQLLALAGVAGALGFVAGKVLKLASGLQKISKVTGLGKVLGALNRAGSGGGAGPTLTGRAAGVVKRGARAVGRGARAVADGSALAAAPRAARAVKDKGVAAAKGAGRAVTGAGKAAARAGKQFATGAVSLAKWGWTSFARGATIAGRALLTGGRAVVLWLVQGVKMTAMLVRQAALWVINTTRMLLARGAILAAAAAQKAWTVAQLLFNAAMAANPLGLAVIAIAAVVAGLIYAYKHFEGFRKIVNSVFSAVVKAARWLWDVLFGHSIFPDMIAGFRWFFKIAKAIFKGVGKALNVLGGWFKWLWTKIVRPYMRFVGAMVQTVWRVYYKPITKAIWDALKTLGGWFKWLWQKIVRPYMQFVGEKVRNIWRNWIKPAFDAIKSGIGNVAKAFRTAKDNIAKWWDQIRAAVRKPIKAVLELVNKWVIGKFNYVSKKLGGPTVPAISLKGFAQGGRVMADKVRNMARGGKVPGWSPNATADNIPAVLTADEEVIRRGAARKFRRLNPGLLEHINQHGSLPGQEKAMSAFAAGGRVLAAGAKRAVDGAVAFARGGRVVWPTIGRRVSSYPGHDGVDINQPPGPNFGAPIFAYRSGRITYVGSGRGYGAPAIFEKADAGPEVVYGHASRATVGAGQRVSAGQVIGNVGSTGNSSGPHLHFGVPGGTYAGALALLNGATSTGQANEPMGGGGFLQQVASFASTLGSKVASIVKAPAKWLMGQAKNAIAGFGAKYGNTATGKMLGKIPPKLIGSAASRISSIFQSKKAAYDKAHPPVSTSNTAGTGSPSSGAGRLVPIMEAARQFAQSRWGPMTIYGYSNRNIGGTNTKSDHAYGKALDLMGAKQDIANYFATGPGHRRFNIENTIYNRRIHNARGWHAYSGASPHTDHVHIDTYDQGGSLYPGSTLSVNRTGKTETVFTNDNMVDMARHLTSTARALHNLINPTTGGGTGPAPLVGELTLNGTPQEMPVLLDEVQHRLRVIRAGGVHVKPAT